MHRELQSTTGLDSQPCVCISTPTSALDSAQQHNITQHRNQPNQQANKLARRPHELSRGRRRGKRRLAWATLPRLPQEKSAVRQDATVFELCSLQTTMHVREQRQHRRSIAGSKQCVDVNRCRAPGETGEAGEVDGVDAGRRDDAGKERETRHQQPGNR